MKTLFALAAVAGLCWGGYKVLGGPSHAQRAAKACSNLADLCTDGTFTRHDVDECTADLNGTSTHHELEIDKFVDCAADATSCPEIIGCVAGAANDPELRDFGKGFDRSRKH